MSRRAGRNPRQARTASSVFPFWHGKGRQSQGTWAAIHAISDFSSEPKRSTPFTNFQFQAQVLHFLNSPSALLPRRSLSIFQRSDGLSQVAMRRRHTVRETLFGPIGVASTPICRRSISPFPWEVCGAPLPVFPLEIRQVWKRDRPALLRLSPISERSASIYSFVQ